MINKIILFLKLKEPIWFKNSDYVNYFIHQDNGSGSGSGF